MTVNFENESRIPSDLPFEEIAELVISAALEEENCPYEAEVNVLITDPEKIRELNRNFRGIDQETDVLSFPMLEFETPADFSFLEEDASEQMEDGASFNPDSGELLLGDIVISLRHVISQAEEYGHSQKREYAFLLAHSMLHLCGFDHMELEEREEMEEEQRRIMERVHIPRER